jgi:Fe-S oxidoreductase
MLIPARNADDARLPARRISPAKSFRPRKIMMDTRDRLEDIGRNMQANKGAFKDDGKSLIGDYILEEEILACTTCNACVQECPVLINPLDIILQLRRYKIMDEAHAPASWNAMFQNLDTNQAPWKFSPGDRFNWADGLAPKPPNRILKHLKCLIL